MRSLKKNQQKLWYSTYAGQITEYYYNNPVSFCANISVGKGTSQES